MDRLDRILGCFLAGACGDALGNPVEFYSGEMIRSRYGDAGVREMQLNGGVAEITDDTQMTLFTAEGMLCSLRHGRDVTACIYQSYLDWMHTQGYRRLRGIYHSESRLLPVSELHHRRAPGNTCLGALESGKMGTLEEPINRSKGCGGVMRTAPCGMLKLLDGGEEVYALQGARAAAITHSHLMGYVPAAMLADMIHRILTEEAASLEEIVLASLDCIWELFAPQVDSADGCEADEGESSGVFAQMLEFRSLIHRAVKLAREDHPDEAAIDHLGEGWVGDEALAIAVYCCLKYPHSMEDCLCAAVTHKGDSDSTGAVAGNILGAWQGVQAVPQRWLQVLEARETIENMARAVWAMG